MRFGYKIVQPCLNMFCICLMCTDFIYFSCRYHLHLFIIRIVEIIHFSLKQHIKPSPSQFWWPLSCNFFPGERKIFPLSSFSKDHLKNYPVDRTSAASLVLACQKLWKLSTTCPFGTATDCRKNSLQNEANDTNQDYFPLTKHISSSCKPCGNYHPVGSLCNPNLYKLA